jgi:nicotinate-nucleotide adenylyltransferase
MSVRPPVAMPGQRVGIMGGSFNPPHDGHLIAATTALRRLQLDQLWWVVTPGNPLKNHDGLRPLAERLLACRKMAKDRRFFVTGFEAELGSPYTAATLAFLKMRSPGVRFVWVMGADNLASFHRWQNWQSIAGSIPIAVVDRPGWRHKALASAAGRALEDARIPEGEAPLILRARLPAWVFLTSRLSTQSSTALRQTRSR